MIVRTGPAAVFRYKVTASVRPWRVDTRAGDVSTISPTGCSDGSGVWRTVTLSKATSQRRGPSAAQRIGVVSHGGGSLADSFTNHWHAHWATLYWLARSLAH